MIRRIPRPRGCRDGTDSFLIGGFKGRRIAFESATVSNKGSRSALLWDRSSAIKSDNTRDFSSLPLLIATSPANLAVNVRFWVLAGSGGWPDARDHSKKLYSALHRRVALMTLPEKQLSKLSKLITTSVRSNFGSVKCEGSSKVCSIFFDVIKRSGVANSCIKNNVSMSVQPAMTRVLEEWMNGLRM